MKVKCAECGKRYRIKDSLVSPQGIKIRCPNCNSVFPVYADTVEDFSDQSGTTEDTSKIATETTSYTESSNEAAVEEKLEATHVHEETPTPSERTETAMRPDQAVERESEISFPGEISQIDFESEASFEEDLLSRGEESISPRLAATVINPEPHPRKRQSSRRKRETTTSYPPQRQPRTSSRQVWPGFFLGILLTLLIVMMFDYLTGSQIRSSLTNYLFPKPQVVKPQPKVVVAQPKPTPEPETPVTTPEPSPQPPKPQTKPKPKPKPTIKKKAAAKKPPQVSKRAKLKALLTEGEQYYERELYTKALDRFQQAQKLAGKEDTTVLTKIGYVWFKLYRLDEAYNNFNRAVELEPNQAEAHKGLAMVYDQLGDLEKAAREYSLYLQLKPNAEDAAKIRQNLRSLQE